MSSFSRELLQYASVNIGSNAWDIHPYYAVAVLPIKKLETSWRIHYLWNGTNADPPIGQRYRCTQAVQAIHSMRQRFT
jgi:hypothetical protein